MRLLRHATRVARSDDSGFTVVELVIASSILLIATISVVSVLTYAGLSSAQTATRSRALNFANQRLEQARNLPYDNVGVYYPDGTTGDPAGTIAASETVGTFQVQTRVTWARDPVSGRSEYKDIKITVSWTKPRPGELSVASAIYGTSALTNSGDLKVLVREMGSGGVGSTVPIPMAQVRITPNGSATQRVVWADLNGEAFAGALPIGLTPVTVTADGWLFDDSLLSTVTVVPDLVTSVYAYGYRACTAAVTVIDTSGTPVPNATVQITDSKGRTKTATTLGDGVASFTQLVPDTYNAVATFTGRQPGYGSFGDTVGGSAYTLTIRLTQVVPPGSLRVRVTGGGAPLSNAVVTVTGPSPGTSQIAGSPKTTPTSGEAVFTGVASGTYTVSVARTGYQNGSASVTVVSGVEAIVPVNLIVTGSTTGSLRIYVVDNNGDPVPRNRVYIWGPDSYYYEARVDDNGQMTLTNLTPGNYTVRARNGETKNIQVTGGTTAVVQVATY